MSFLKDYTFVGNSFLCGLKVNLVFEWTLLSVSHPVLSSSKLCSKYVLPKWFCLTDYNSKFPEPPTPRDAS